MSRYVAEKHLGKKQGSVEHQLKVSTASGGGEEWALTLILGDSGWWGRGTFRKYITYSAILGQHV